MYLYDENDEETIHVLSGNIDKNIYIKMSVNKKPANYNHDTVLQAQDELFHARVTSLPVIKGYVDENNENKQFELHITPSYTTDKGYIVKFIDILDGYGVRFNDDHNVIIKDSIDPLPQSLHKIQGFSLDNIPILQETKNANIESIHTTPMSTSER